MWGTRNQTWVLWNISKQHMQLTTETYLQSLQDFYIIFLDFIMPLEKMKLIKGLLKEWLFFILLVFFCIFGVCCLFVLRMIILWTWSLSCKHYSRASTHAAPELKIYTTTLRKYLFLVLKWNNKQSIEEVGGRKGKERRNHYNQSTNTLNIWEKISRKALYCTNTDTNNKK